MRLEGATFFLAAALLALWGVLLALGLGLGWSRHKAFVIVVSVATGALVTLLVAVFGDGRAAMQQRPLGTWAVFVLLLLAAAPAMLAAPFLLHASHQRGRPGRFPMALLVAALLAVPTGAILHLLLQEGLERRALAQARALTPGRVLPHVVAARERAATSWLSPYLWNEEAESKWIIIGLGRLGFIESPAPLSSEDAQALALLVESSAGTRNAVYTWTLEGKLVWDRLMGAAAGDRPAVAAGLTKQQAQRFNEYIGVPHADWLCAPLADPQTREAFDQVWTRLPDHDRNQLSAAVREKCGRAIGAATALPAVSPAQETTRPPKQGSPR